MNLKRTEERTRQVLFVVAILFGPLISTPTVLGESDERGMTDLQSQAIQQLPGLRKLRLDEQSIPEYIEADLGKFRDAKEHHEIDSLALMQLIGPSLRAEGMESVQVRKVSTDPDRNLRHYRMQQFIGGRKVVGGEMIVHVDGDTDLIYAVDSNFLPETGLPQRATVPGTSITIVIENDLEGTNIQIDERPELVYLRTRDGSGFLAWQARASYTLADGKQRLDDVFVDATSGAFIELHPRRYDALNRKVFDGSTTYINPPLIVSEGGSTSDIQAQNLMTFMKDTYDYYWFRFFRNSWNGLGSNMEAIVHAYSFLNNAVWSNGQTYYDDGDGVNYGPSSAARDIVGHEFAHGVTESEADLVYEYESGALNEAMSDIFGASVEARVTGVSANTWKIGENWKTPNVSGDAERYMNDPALNGYSRDYYPDVDFEDPSEQNNVHSNSGIANLAFYLLSEGGTHPRGKTTNSVSGIGNQTADRIFYLALRDKLLMNDEFTDARNKTAKVAQELFGVNSNQYLQTCEAWDAVGVPNDSTVCTGVTNPIPPPGNVWETSGECFGWFRVKWTFVAGATRYEAYISNSLTVPGNLVYSGPKRSQMIYAPSGYPYDYVQVKACDSSSCSTLSTAYAALWRKNICP